MFLIANKNMEFNKKQIATHALQRKGRDSVGKISTESFFNKFVGKFVTPIRKRRRAYKIDI